MAASSSPRRTQVEAIDDLTAQIRLSNQISALKLGSSALDHDTGARANTAIARARVSRMNTLRADIRAGLGIEEVSDGDRG